jgi:hypothetical protein
MDRRTFLLLTGAGSAAIARPPRLAARRARTLERLRFELDDARRWSLWYLGQAQPVPLIQGATLGVWIGDQLVTLADLEYSAVGNRRPPSGGAAGVQVEAELLAGRSDSTLAATITLSVYPDRERPRIAGARFLDLAPAQLLPGDEPLVVLTTGPTSRDDARILTIPAAPNAVAVASCGAAGLSRGNRGLALAFDADTPGDGRMRSSPDGLEVRSDWTPPRPLRLDGDTARLRICYEPDGDGLDALRALYAPVSPGDRARMATVPGLAGWCSGSERGATEADITATLDFCAGRFDRRFFRLIELGRGYERAAGDWDANDAFPHGHRWLTDQIHSRGLQAGLWLAPFAVSDRSGIPGAHPDWLVRDAGDQAPAVVTTGDAWGGRVYALDGAHPGAREWLSALARRAVRDWGYDALRLDHLEWGMAGGAPAGGLTRAEGYRLGLAALRDGAGAEAFLIGAGAPLAHSSGYVNAMRIAPAVAPSWNGIQAPARTAALRSFFHRAVWLNDPGGVTVAEPLTLPEAQLVISLAAVAGGMAIFSGKLADLPPERLELLDRALPPAPVAGRPIGAMRDEPVVAPALTSGADRFPVAGPWKFRTGDDPRYGARDYDETAWESMAVPASWEEAGHPGYRGVAWYRTRFSLPASRPQGSVALELGKVADADETYVNGSKVGQTGEWQPPGRGAPESYRRYAVPADLLNWGGDNVLAVRVFAGAGGGGLVSLRRDRPAGIWVAEGAPRWWTVVVVNWEDAPTRQAIPLTTLGIGGSRFNAYDVWHGTPLDDLTDTLTTTLDPHSAAAIAIRPVQDRPQVVGTTRHVIQGAVDVADETWDQATRTLRGHAGNLDRRAYAVTIAVPKGLRSTTCKADRPCVVKRAAATHVVLEWPAAGGEDLSWAVSFASAGAAKRGG